MTLDEIQTISFTDVDEMRSALKGYLESVEYTVGNHKGIAWTDMILCGNISKEIMDNDATTDMFTELPSEFHESALLERFHGFIKGWNIPRMNDGLKVNGWVLNSDTNLNLKVSQTASGFFVRPRRRPEGLLAASRGATTQVWRKRRRRMVEI